LFDFNHHLELLPTHGSKPSLALDRSAGFSMPPPMATPEAVQSPTGGILSTGKLSDGPSAHF
jgi:hypothetical protein